MIGRLPEFLTVGGREYKIRPDFRNVLQIFEASTDPDLLQGEKWIVAIYLLLKPFNNMDDVLDAVRDGFDFEDAVKQIIWFLTGGKDPGDKKELPTYDWIQDEQLIFSAVNKITGRETRELEYLHWWTFLGYFNEIGEGNFTFIVGIRNKRNKRKKLEKHEQEFYNKNKDLVDLVRHESREELERKAEYKEIWKGLV